MDYLVHFDTSSNDHDSWTPLSAIYEINPRTRRIFEGTADKRENMNDDDDEVEVRRIRLLCTVVAEARDVRLDHLGVTERGCESE